MKKTVDDIEAKANNKKNAVSSRPPLTLLLKKATFSNTKQEAMIDIQNKIFDNVNFNLPI